MSNLQTEHKVLRISFFAESSFQSFYVAGVWIQHCVGVAQTERELSSRS